MENSGSPLMISPPALYSTDGDFFLESIPVFYYHKTGWLPNLASLFQRKQIRSHQNKQPLRF
jgi:hypothetical protein